MQGAEALQEQLYTDKIAPIIERLHREMRRPQCSVFHHMLEHFIVAPEWRNAQVFLVGYDAAKLLAERVDADGPGDEAWYLPFPRTTFEFLVGQTKIVALAHTLDPEHIERTGHVMSLTVCKQEEDRTWGMVQGRYLNGKWALSVPGQKGLAEFQALPSSVQDTCRALLHFAVSQVQALCILLDVELFETELVRASASANNKRIRHGKVPFFDYHELKVKLTRSSVVVDQAGTCDGPSVRLHIRRGHWHNFHTKEGKVRKWLKAMWVGDPDLGFVDKIYRLGR